VVQQRYLLGRPGRIVERPSDEHDLASQVRGQPPTLSWGSALCLGQAVATAGLLIMSSAASAACR
jgi:hypothetical protein